METDTIRKGIVIQLADEPVEIASTYDHETGGANYRIAIVSDEATVAEGNDSHNSHIFCGLEWHLRLLSQFCLL